MALVESLLSAIIRSDADALVLHVGEPPYVVTASSQMELSPRALTLEAMSGMLGQLLSPATQKSLDEIGAVEHELAGLSAAPETRFSVVAARTGDDIWVEIRRQRHAARVSGPPSGEKSTAADPSVVAEPLPGSSETPAVIALQPTAVQADPSISAPERTANRSPTSNPTAPMDEAAPRRRQADRVLGPDTEMPPVTMVPVPPSRAQAPRTAPPEPQAAIVLPLARGQVRGDQAPRMTLSPKPAGLDRLLRLAAARGASTLYLISGLRPSLRVDGEISLLDGETPLSAPDVESLIFDVMPERSRGALRDGIGTEWICDVGDAGPVRCISFRDHRGVGGIFRMIPPRTVSAEQLGLSREIQSLCAETDGLVLAASPRAGGKSTLIAAFVDLINRTRGGHIITLERQITLVHESRMSLISQRELRGGNEALVVAGRAALRENPDVLVIEDLHTPELVTLALEAAESGHLVIGSLLAHTTTAAIDRIIDQTALERRPNVRLALAGALRGIVAQVLVRKAGGGRLAAREVLLNTSAVAHLVIEGKTSQLPLALDSGRKDGMVPLNDALLAFVQSGAVESREAYRQACDRQGFLAQLRREGMDTSFVELPN